MTRDELKALPFGAVLHYLPACRNVLGPKGGVGRKQERWRINGAMVEWKTRPTQFHRPVKFGLRTYGRITEQNVHQFVAEGQCPVCDSPPKPRG